MISSKYRVTEIVVTNAPTTLPTAVGGIYNGTAKPIGGVIVPDTQVYSTLTGTASQFLVLTLGGVALTDTQTAAALQFSLTIADAGGTTADIYVFGQDLS